MTYDLTASFAQSPIVHQNKRWVVHHSVTPTLSPVATMQDERMAIDQIDRYHRTQRGFGTGFGYHVAVFQSGRSYRIGKQGTQRAHVGGLNHLYDGLVLVGTFTQIAPNTASLMEAAKVILDSGMPLAGGHKDVTAGATECPGAWDISLLRTFMDAPRVSRPLSVGDVATLYRAVMPGLPAVARPSGVTIEPQPVSGNRRVYTVRMPL